MRERDVDSEKRSEMGLLRRERERAAFTFSLATFLKERRHTTAST
jgi:hypothetical protein